MKHKTSFLIALKSAFLTQFFILSPILNGEEDYQKYAMFGKSAKRAESADHVVRVENGRGRGERAWQPQHESQGRVGDAVRLGRPP